MAIGIAKIFGFEFPENFNFPYISKSIQEFWQRWHISLSNWLREYLFTPLSLKLRASGKAGVVISLIITFTICGLWHGPSWTYVLWGLLYGFFLALESIGFSKILKRLWFPIRHLYVLIIIIIGWVLFRAETFEYARGFIKSMIGCGTGINKYAVVSIYLTNEYYVCLIISVLGAARIFGIIQESYLKLSCKFPKSICKVSENILFAGKVAGLILIMISSTMYMVTTTYNPFIYFRF
jgi:alginate O-acetyltransferase complex protein AlgI